MTNDKFDELVRRSGMYDWKDGPRYYVGPLIDGKGKNVTRKIIKARKELVEYVNGK